MIDLYNYKIKICIWYCKKLNTKHNINFNLKIHFETKSQSICVKLCQDMPDKFQTGIKDVNLTIKFESC